MTIFTVAATYVIVWWLVLFMALPVGIKPSAESGGRVRGHPGRQRILDRCQLAAGPGVEGLRAHAGLQGSSRPSSRTLTCCSTACSRSRQ